MKNKQKQLVSSTEIWAAMLIYITADAMTAPIGGQAGNMSWFSILIAIVVSLGITWVYSQLADKNSGKSITGIAEGLMGKWFGKVIAFVYGWFSLELSSYNLKNNWQMTSIVALPNTPIIIIAILAMILVIWIAYGGIETIGRLSLIYIPALIAFLGIAFLLLSRDFNIKNFLPIIEVDWRKIFYASFQVTTLPLLLSIVFVMIFPSINKKGNVKKPALYAILTGGFLIFLADVLYVLVLGPLVPNLTYPGYTTFSYVEAADFLDRAEIVLYSLFISISIIEISISLYVAALCFADLFGLKNYRILLIPLGFLTLEQSLFIVKNHSDHISLAQYGWPWYAIIFQFLIPLFLLIVSAFKKGKEPGKGNSNTNANTNENENVNTNTNPNTIGNKTETESGN
ncbi:spore germination protein YndE [Ruminiclostridium hungatei]|uniref:Spore germination protein YndE n=1 Tax=Ruminiclostridium hungatei TaxID=48256 RepID=A0A1V4SFF7_RUMHU|nr:endospore germination permease [Ruminiclostridium hungatei]OPX42652.1 spore germination protein YndE [Ruminiclostridium hungatei]